MTSPSRALKKELTQAFPGVKFSVKTDIKMNICVTVITVNWNVELGSNATTNAVKAITDQYEDLEAYGDISDDSRSYIGTTIRLNPTFSTERQQWAIECVTKEYGWLTYNPRFKEFQDADGRKHFGATDKYRHYLNNGTTSNLVNEEGQEPDEKREYYANSVQSQEIKVEQSENQEDSIATQPVSIQTVTTEEQPTLVKIVDGGMRDGCIEIALEINQDKVVFKSSKPEGDRDLLNRVNKYLQFLAMQFPGAEVKVKTTIVHSNGTSSEETINLSPIDFFKATA